jgi:hypothetical protein
MYSKMRRNLAGIFSAQNLGSGAWRLARGAPAPAELFLRGVESGAADAFGSPDLGDVDIEWLTGSVLLTMTAAGARRSFNAQSAIVHEPLSNLYDALPLAALDEKARRFWRRVFRLVRLPGGRYLLGVLARRSRK